jgi:hypothetical protein
MKEFLDMALSFTQGKPIYPPLRRVLNFLFILSISSFIYEKIYGKYTWLEYNDYKGILDFFIKGHFFIPFSIFIIVYELSEFISNTFFTMYNDSKSTKIQTKFLNYQFKKQVETGLMGNQKASEIETPINITPDWMIQTFLKIRDKVEPSVFAKFERKLQKSKRNLEANFNLGFRALIAITLYFSSLPQFGWLLYIIVLLVIIGGMYILCLAYRLCDIIPTILRVFYTYVEEYLKDQTEISHENT